MIGLSFTIAGPRDRSNNTRMFESSGTNNHILLWEIRDSLNLDGQVPMFIFLRDRVSQSYLQSLVSLFVASYDSQGYGGGIRPASTRSCYIHIFSGVL
jgi:hypothetical protein